MSSVGPEDPDPWGPNREHYSPLGDAEDAFWNAIERWWRARAAAWGRFWGPRIARRRAQLRAFQRWLALSLAPKDDGVVAELTSVQQFITPTAFSPLRLIAWVTMLISAVFVGMWAWVALVRLPAVKAERDDAREQSKSALDANAKWQSAYTAMKARVDGADAAMKAQSQAQARELVDAGVRAGQAVALRRSAAKRQTEIMDEARAPNPTFNGAEWMRRRVEAHEGSRGADPAASPAAPDAGVRS